MIQHDDFPNETTPVLGFVRLKKVLRVYGRRGVRMWDPSQRLGDGSVVSRDRGDEEWGP